MLHGRNALDDRRMPLIDAGANFLKRQMRVLAYEIEKRIARNDDFAAAQAGEGKPLTVYAAPGAEAFFAHMGFAAVGEETWAGATWRVMRREAATAK